MRAAQDQAQARCRWRANGPRSPAGEPIDDRHLRSRPTSRSPASVTPRPIVEVARELGFRDDEVELYGNTKAKVTIEGIERLERERRAASTSW